MDRNHWYNHQNYSPRPGHHTSGSPQVPADRVAADSVQDAQRLLAVYPMASATPSDHTARHLGAQNMHATVPSYTQPQYYSMNGASYSHNQGNPPSYGQYAHEVDYLSSQQQQPLNDSGYWENARNDAVRYLGDQSGPSNYVAPTQWAPPTSTPSSHRTNAFAQSVFQRTAPSSSYPTPPPPGITTNSSSLAFALGVPAPRPQPQNHSQPPPPQQPHQQVHRPEESAQFFNQFLEQKTRQMTQTPSHQPLTPSHANGSQVQDSPDPLALAPGNGLPTTAVTPRKRKPGTHAETPSVKRVNSTSILKTPGKSLAPMTPSSSHSQTFKSTKKVHLQPYIELPATPTSSQSQSQRSTSTTKSITKLQPYIEMPALPKSYFTPSRSVSSKSVGSLSRKMEGGMKVDDTPDDLGGYGSVDDDDFSPTRNHGFSSVKSSARRTGDRDDRAPLEKLTSLIEDIFEAEDALPADISPSDLPAEWFSPMSTDGASPLLHPNRIRKLAKYIGQITRPTKRIRLSESTVGSGGTPKGKGRITEVDIGILGRIMKILERSVKSGEDLDPFHYVAVTREKSASPRKKKTAKRPKANEDEGAKGEGPEEADVVMEEPVPPPPEVTDSDLENLTRLMDVAKDSVLAADCCIALLGSDRLNKQLYSEELITTCLSTIKNQLTKVVYPFVEASDLGNSQTSPLLQHLHKSTSSDVREHRRQLSEIFQALTSVMPRITNLVCAGTVMMSDSIIIQTVYIGIGPFFVVESGIEGDTKGKKQNVVLSTLGNSSMRGLRLDALSLIRNVFANHVDQRSWIIEEILSSLIKLSDTNKKAGQFRLRDGRSIRTVSALLLQLVQTSAHDVRLAAGRISKARQQVFALRRQESNTDLADEPFLDEHDSEEIRLYSSGLESARTAAKTIVVFLTQRSGKGKATKTSNEADYRTIFDNLISDLLVVLFWPEWPAASLLLGIVCKFMVSSLDDVKTSNQVENNAAKSIALDHLGVIAARIRSSTLKFKSLERNATESSSLKPMDEIISGLDPKEFEKLLAVHQDVASHLCKRSSEDQAYDSARELTAATWGQELAVALKQANVWIQDPEEEEMGTKADRKRAMEFGKNVKVALREVWIDPATDVFDIGSQDDVIRVDRFAEEVGSIQSLKSSFQPILNVVLQALDAPPVFMRTKALRALGQIVTSDPTILSSPNVRHAIESHLLDSSPAVRDAAVELIGKYMIDSPEVAGDYYQKIADRIADTGLGVRKRVIKLLKSFYIVTDTVSRRVDVCTKLVLRMMDEDDTVKDLAIKTVEELWFQSTPVLVSAMKGKAPIANNPSDKTPLLAKVTVIMGVASNFKDRQSPLEDLLHKIIADKDGDTSNLRAGYAEICEALIDGLVDASDLPGFTVINCVRTIHLFTSAYPAFLSGPNASTLLPYLKNATTSEEQATSDYLLKIFRACIPHMPKTAAKFGNELQLVLQPMIIKPSSAGGVLALQETVACLCTVVQYLTHDFVRLVALVKSCNARLQQAIARPVAQQMNPVEIKTLSILIFIVSLLGEHCNFDRLRLEHETLAADLNSITKGSIIEHIYMNLLRLYQKHTEAALRGRILQCLGFLFRAQPSLMTLNSSATIMDAIFSSPDEESRGRLLRIMQEFLLSEAAKHTAKEKENSKSKTKGGDVNMEELVGNTDGFADSGVSSAIVQRYLGPILEAALSQHIQIQAVAIDVLSFTVKQGLAHPLQSFPVIVALETSANTGLSSRASALHAILHSKHTSLLNTRYTVSAKASFDYQKKLYGSDVQGYRMQPIPTALMQRWYSLVREKRASRQDFLKALVKVFDVNSSLKSSQDDVDFTRYMVENFSAFDYKTLEEVLTVIKHLTSVLSTAGMQLVEVLSPSNLLTQLHGTAEASSNATEPQQPAEPGPIATPTQALDNVEIMRTSVIIAMTMLLKAHLKSLYGLSEEKCSKFVAGKKSAAGDKPAVKRNENPISWQRLPFSKAPLLTSEDLATQKTRFLDIWNEDGLTAEPEEDDFA